MAEQFDVPAPTPRQHWTALTALVGSIGLAGFVLVACSSGSSKSATPASPSASSSAAAGSAAAGTAGATSATGTAGATSSTSPVGSSATSSSAVPHGNSASSFCSFARQVSTQQSKNVAVFTSGNPAAIQRLEKQELSVLNAAVTTAPSSIRPSMVIIANVDKALYKELQKVKFDFRKLSPTVTAGLDSAALTHASDTVASYLTNVCHISTAAPTTR